MPAVGTALEIDIQRQQAIPVLCSGVGGIDADFADGINWGIIIARIAISRIESALDGGRFCQFDVSPA